MKCDNCKISKATIFVSQKVGDKFQKVNLCKQCASEKGIEDPTAYALVEMLEGMGKQMIIGSGATRDEPICPDCGFSLTDTKKTGRYGCANCYQVFRDRLDPLLEAIQKKTRHEGKVPRPCAQSLAPNLLSLENPAAIENPEIRLSELRQALSKSVEGEDYEEAARLRDEISKVESSYKNC